MDAMTEEASTLETSSVDDLQAKLARIRGKAAQARTEDRLPYRDSDTWTDQLPLD